MGKTKSKGPKPMEKKNVLVTFVCQGENRRALQEAAAEQCNIFFREPDWTREQYIEALEKAHVIIGEPRNEEFVYCKTCS